MSRTLFNSADGNAAAITGNHEGDIDQGKFGRGSGRGESGGRNGERRRKVGEGELGGREE
jgi:hypothetical protein